MGAETESLYEARLKRYVTAMRNEQPDMVPIRPLVAEFVGKHAGFTCQEITHDYHKACEAVIRTARDFDWDAMVCNMVYVWTGLTQALGLKYYGIPGIGIPADGGFNYIEPPEDQAFMREDEYDALIDDPTAFLYEVWLPRVSTEVVGTGSPSSYRSNLALVKGAMAMLDYFGGLGAQVQRMKTETGTVSAVNGIFKAPFDIIADKLRGYVGLTMDMRTQPDKVLKACEAMAAHLTHVGLTTADPNKQLPIGFWMHRGCVPFITPDQFKSHYWPTLRPCIEEFWKAGHQTLFYAEGNWDFHLDDFLELPERSIVYHVDRGDIFNVHKKLHQKFALSGGIPNVQLSYGKPDDVRATCRKVLEEVAKEGGYILDASAIMQNDTNGDNLRALTDFAREHGVYSGAAHDPGEPLKLPCDDADTSGLQGRDGRPEPRVKPGVCLPWETKRAELPEITGSEELVQRIWENVDALGNVFIWQCLLSF